MQRNIHVREVSRSKECGSERWKIKNCRKANGTTTWEWRPIAKRSDGKRCKLIQWERAHRRLTAEALELRPMTRRTSKYKRWWQWKFTRTVLGIINNNLARKLARKARTLVEVKKAWEKICLRVCAQLGVGAELARSPGTVTIPSCFVEKHVRNISYVIDQLVRLK